MNKEKETKLNSNISSMSVGNMASVLGEYYSNIIKDNEAIDTFPSVMLWGAPGIGKSQGIRQMAEIIQKDTGKTVVITDVRLILFNPVDLRGIPTANNDKTLAIWLKPKIFQMDNSKDIVNILFLDELSAAPQSVQAAAYQIVLDRQIGEHKLPNNCLVIGAGNRVTDASVAIKMPKALANRFLHIEIEVDFDSWKQWAVLNKIDSQIIAFLSFNNGNLMKFDPSSSELAFATPRSWEMASKVIQKSNGDVNKAFPLLCGCIGTGLSVEFKKYCKVFHKLPNIPDIFHKGTGSIPIEADVLYATISAIYDYILKNNPSSWELSNMINYAFTLPVDFYNILFMDFMSLKPEIKNILVINTKFSTWLKKQNGI
jgi:energy-coupling factor transporter ATP-binding protein EcfA2